MALTLVEASKLSNDTLLAGVIETIAQESPVLQRLPFVEIVGNGLTYNRENAAPSADFYDVGDAWDESTPTFTQATATLKILGGDADIDNFLKSTRCNIQDLEAAVVQLKAKAVQGLFDDTFVNGDDGANPKSFDGIDVLCTAGQTVSHGRERRDTDAGEAGRAGRPRARRQAGHAPDEPPHPPQAERAGARLRRLPRGSRDEFGQMLQFYDGIPIGLNDFIADDRTVGTSSDCSTIYAMQFGEGALSGLTAPGGLTVERVGSLETKDASRVRVKWYASLALFNSVKLARLTGVRP